MNIAIEVFCIALISSPYIWECWDDRARDSNKKEDVCVRMAIAVLASGIVALISDHNLWATIIFSGSIHFLLFDYTIAAIYGHPDWFEYLGAKSKIDNLPFWRNMNPYYRFGLRLAVFGLGLILYIKL